MKSKFFILLIFLPFLGYSQIFSLSELVKLTNNNFDNFDTYVTSKGYSFYVNRDEESSTARCYSYGQKDYTRMASFFITYFWNYPDSKKVLISWQTSNKNNYLKIKNELKTLNYKFVNEESFEGCSNLTYKKGFIHLNLYSCQRPDDNGNMSATYEISVTNYKE